MEAVEAMAATVQVGTILIENRPLILRALDLDSESYVGTWGVLRSHTRITLDQKMRSTGWKYFIMTAELKATVFGGRAANTVRRALKQIFTRVREPDFNCLEVTKIVEGRFLGVPYLTVSAHSRHIQQGSIMELTDESKSFKTGSAKFESRKT
jgi:hypothetical protein